MDRKQMDKRYMLMSPEFYLSDDEFICDNESNTCVITREAFQRLPEYSTTIPTGVVPGKRWKCNVDVNIRPAPCWFIRGYDEEPMDENLCINRMWKILEIV